MSAEVLTPDIAADQSADRAWALIELRRWKEAVAEAQRALAHNPQHFSGLYNLSVAQRRGGDAAAAEQTARALVGYFPGSASAFNILSRALKDQRKYGDAIIASRESVRLGPNDADLWINLADVLILQKDFAQGLEACEKAIRLNPNAAMAHNNHAVGLEEFNRNTEAEAAYRKAMQLDPLNPLFHSNLGWLMNKQKQYKAAASFFYSAVKLDPANKEYQKNMDKAMRKVYPISQWLTVAHGAMAFAPFVLLVLLVLMGYARFAPGVFLVALVAVIVYAVAWGSKVEANVKERYLQRKLKELA
jgi:tetratricopeptide (TPR) repeat protein